MIAFNVGFAGESGVNIFENEKRLASNDNLSNRIRIERDFLTIPIYEQPHVK